MSDYLQQGEGAEDAVARLREIIGGGIAEGAVPRELEGPAGAVRRVRLSRCSTARAASTPHLPFDARR